MASCYLRPLLYRDNNRFSPAMQAYPARPQLTPQVLSTDVRNKVIITATSGSLTVTSHATNGSSYYFKVATIGTGRPDGGVPAYFQTD